MSRASERRRRATSVFAALVMIGWSTAGCARGTHSEGPQTRSLRPAFPPAAGGDAGGGEAPTTQTSPNSAPASGAAGPEDGGAAVTSPAAIGTGTVATGTASEPPPAAVSEADDPLGDLTESVEAPPEWADLTRARLARTDAGFELRVRMAGGRAPARAQDDDHSMNVASFYDVDGDGEIDYEIWLNLADDGWYPGYFRPEPEGKNLFREESGVTVTTDGDELVVSFPSAHLREAERFRWSVASEWGRHEALGTPAAARDDVPDDDGFVTFAG